MAQLWNPGSAYVKLKDVLTELIKLGCRDTGKMKGGVGLWQTQNGRRFSLGAPHAHTKDYEPLYKKLYVDDLLEHVQILGGDNPGRRMRHGTLVGEMHRQSPANHEPDDYSENE